MATWTVTRATGSPWQIRHEVLAIAEHLAGGSLSWQIDGDTFTGTAIPDPDRPLTAAQAHTLREAAQQAILAAHQRGYTLHSAGLEPAEDSATLTAYTTTGSVLMDAISALEATP